MRKQQLEANFKRYKEMSTIEPGLTLLLEAVRERKSQLPKRRNCAKTNEIWYQDFKPWMCDLVGMMARKTELRSSHDYDIAYNVLYYTLTGETIG